MVQSDPSSTGASSLEEAECAKLLSERFEFIALNFVGQEVEVVVLVDDSDGESPKTKTLVGLFQCYGPIETLDAQGTKADSLEHSGSTMNVVLLGATEKGAPATTLPTERLVIDGRDIVRRGTRERENEKEREGGREGGREQNCNELNPLGPA